METKTKTNLLRAFAGECQARMRYEMAAKSQVRMEWLFYKICFILLQIKRKSMR